MPPLEEALALARAAGLKGRTAHCLAAIAAALAEAGDTQRARMLLDEGQELARTAQDRYVQLWAGLISGWVAIADGHLEEADTHFREILDRATRSGSAPAPVTLLGLGQVCLLQGDLEQAQELHRRALIQVQETEPGGMTMADALLDTACVEEVAGRHARAQRLLGANETWYDAHGGAGRVWRPTTRNPLKRGLLPAPPLPTDPLLMQERAEGQGMSLDEAVAFALEAPDLSPREASPANA
jgi:tetratricopeptide (TPR) repeat protein